MMIGDHLVDIRDQLPLRPGSVEFTGGWKLQDLLDELNSRVFFWPGDGVRSRGRSEGHYNKYAVSGAVAVIRMPLRSLLESNPSRWLHVSRCNTGSARSYYGRPVRRGPGIFALPETADFTRGKVVEFSFKEEITLPRETEWSHKLLGPWQRMFPEV